MNICSFTMLGESEILLNVSVSAVNRGNVAKIILAIEGEGGSKVAAGIEVDFNHHKMTLDAIDVSVVGKARELVAQGMGFITQSVLECKYAGAESPLKLINMLGHRGHIISSAISAVAARPA